MTSTAGSRDPVAERYESLIRSGVYTPSFSHGPGERQLVGDTLEPIIAALAARPAVILDCGCGPGAWLEVVAAIAARTGPGRADLHGFDSTPGMIELSERGWPESLPPSDCVGDVLDPLPTTSTMDRVRPHLHLRWVRAAAGPTVCGDRADVGHARSGWDAEYVCSSDSSTIVELRIGLKKWLTMLSSSDPLITALLHRERVPAPCRLRPTARMVQYSRADPHRSLLAEHWSSVGCLTTYGYRDRSVALPRGNVLPGQAPTFSILPGLWL